MAPFTSDNTEGFSDADLETLNAALSILIDRNPTVHEYSLSDAINNAWIDAPQTAKQLADATIF